MPANILNQNGRLIISGDLNFSTVTTLWKQSLPLLSAVEEINFDLSQVKSSNSAGLALLLEWLKYAKRVKKTIRFSEIPNQLKSILSAGGIEDLICNRSQSL